jgi:hypothetical protein
MGFYDTVHILLSCPRSYGVITVLGIKVGCRSVIFPKKIYSSHIALRYLLQREILLCFYIVKVLCFKSSLGPDPSPQ